MLSQLPSLSRLSSLSLAPFAGKLLSGNKGFYRPRPLLSAVSGLLLILGLSASCRAQVSVTNPVTGMINVTDSPFNAKGDMLIFSDGAISASSTTFTSQSATFTSSDVGKAVAVVGAGSSSGVLTAGITKYLSAHSVTLSAAASTTVSGAQYTYGTDNTPAFVNSMSQAMNSGGGANLAGNPRPIGTVNVPPGAYLIVGPVGGTLNVPNFVRLHGSLEVPSQLSGKLDGTAPSPGDGGPTLGFVEGFGKATAPSYVTLNSNSEIDGVTIVDALQTSGSAPAPTAAPYAINMTGTADRVSNVMLYNVFHWIDHITGQPTAMGICITNGGDIDHVSDVHFVPQFNGDVNGIFGWQLQNGVAFDLVHDDQLRMTNCFCLAYNTGYVIGSSTDSGMYGKMIGCGADLCEEPLYVYATAPAGMTFTDCDFVGRLDNPNYRCLYTPSSFSGLLSFVNCYFNNTAGSAACVLGSLKASVSFTGCRFGVWSAGPNASGEACIQSNGPMVRVSSCDFRWPISSSAQTSAPQFYSSGSVLSFQAVNNTILGGMSLQPGSASINTPRNGATMDSAGNVTVPYSAVSTQP